MIKHNVNIAPYTTFGVRSSAQLFSTFDSSQKLAQLLDEHRSESVLILGGGSNVLFTVDFKGLILINQIKGIEVIEENEEHVYVQVGAGENWHEFVLYAIGKGWGGIENLSLIPGSIGASPMQNIGAYGVEIKDVFHSLTALHRSELNEEIFSHAECEFGYRESVFKRALKDQYVITTVTYKLNKKPKLNTSYGAIETELERKGIQQPTIKDVSDAVIAIRQSKLPDPKEIGNAGSFFKNPVVKESRLTEIQKSYPNAPYYRIDDEHVKIPAGWLIDTAGWKGKRFDNYGVHVNQALVLVNYDDAEGSSIYELSQRILDDISEKFGILLEREVNIIS